MTSKFKVIIIGGGPVGLTAGHALALAGIDFVILERRDSIVLDEGASLVLGPNSLRVMHQLGLLTSLLEIGSEFKHQKLFTLDGKEFKNNKRTVELFKKNHGSGPVLFYRAELVRALYDGLPAEAKTKVLTGKKVINITTDSTSATVSCSDGSSYTGSIILGCDGVHSTTRHLIRNMALTANPRAKWDPETPFVSTFRGMWCSFPRPSAPGEAFETQHKNRSLVYFTSHDRGWIFMFEKLERKVREHVVYGDKDIEAMAERFAEYPVTDALKVKDIFSKRLAVGMANLEEGVVRNWSWGRVVLLGDAVHKYTPNAGLGFNNGIQDIVALCNRLQEAVTEDKTGELSLATLEALFKSYQEERLKALRSHTFVSTTLPRANAWLNWPYYVLARYIMSSVHFELFALDHLVSRFIRKGLVLDYIPVEEPFHAKVRWDHPLIEKGNDEKPAT